MLPLDQTHLKCQSGSCQIEIQDLTLSCPSVGVPVPEARAEISKPIKLISCTRLSGGMGIYPFFTNFPSLETVRILISKENIPK